MKLSTRIRSLFLTLTLVGLVLGLQACGGGGGSTAGGTANANPVGYYAGTLSIVSPSQTDITAKAIVDSDKFLMVHIDNAHSNTLLYKGSFTAITETTFTADVRIYRSGAFLRTATISNGSITEKSSMSGTLSGAGDYTNTSFSLNYDTTVNARPTDGIARSSVASWLEPTTAGTGMLFDSATVSTFAIEAGLAIADSSLRGCEVISIALENVPGEQIDRIQKYTANYLSSSNCDNYVNDFSLDGYITPFDNAGTDNRYLWITFNDNNFFTGELELQ